MAPLVVTKENVTTAQPLATMKTDNITKHKQILAEYLPAEVVDSIYDLIVSLKIHLKVTRQRRSKLGDYTSPTLSGKHQITVNCNLNKYEFLVTFIHEVAHLTTWNKHKGRVNPHGEEWKNEYKTLMAPYMRMHLFPDELHAALHSYFTNPGATKYSDNDLVKAFRSLDEEDDGLVELESLPQNTRFAIPNGSVFIKGELRRKCYTCQNLQSKRLYVFQPMAKVKPLEDGRG